MRGWILALLLVTPTLADEKALTKMLRQLFDQPTEAWTVILSQNRELLNDEFFQKVDERIRWDFANGQCLDAMRFAEAADVALKVLGRKPGYVASVKQMVRPDPQTGLPMSRLVPERARVHPELCPEALKSGRIAARLQDYDRAEELFRAAVVYDPKSLEGWTELAELHATQGKPQLALQDYRQLTVLFPRRQEAWLKLGLLLESRFDGEPDWTKMDQARLAYLGGLGLGTQDPALRSGLKRLDAKAREFAASGLDLRRPALWEIQCGKAYGIGDKLKSSEGLVEEGPMPGEALRQYLGRVCDNVALTQYLPADGYLSEEDLQEGGRDGVSVWVWTGHSQARLCLDGEVVGQIGTPIERWPLGIPGKRFVDRQTGLEIRVYSASLVDIGLEISGGKVRGLWLMEPGRLAACLRQMRRYRAL